MSDSLKKPNDYPLFGYRVLPTIKDTLTAELEEVLTLVNSKVVGDKPLKKNDLFVKALKQGLQAIKKKESL